MGGGGPEGWRRQPVTALALAATSPPRAPNPEPVAEPAQRRAARYPWALLLARIDQVFPLGCPNGGGAMRIIAFLTDASAIRDLLVPLEEPIAPPRIAPARGPPRWEATGAEHQPSADPLLPSAPAFAFDQRRAWSPPPSTPPVRDAGLARAGGRHPPGTGTPARASPAHRVKRPHCGAQPPHLPVGSVASTRDNQIR